MLSLEELSQIEVTSVLGKGAQGQVVLCTTRSNRKDLEEFALKIFSHEDFFEEEQMNKEHLLNINKELKVMKILNEGSQQQKCVHNANKWISSDTNEQDDEVIKQAESNFLIKQKFHLSDSNYTLLGIEFCPGGELFSYMKRKQTLESSEVMFYTANIIIGLNRLHQLGIVYKDLKPENVLIASNGYCKLSDFGLSELESQQILSTKKVEQYGKQTYEEPNFGTPEYFPPEFYKIGTYSKSGDWWALGCFIYELSTGVPPFYSVDIKRQITKILYTDPDMKMIPDEDLRDLLKQLLNKDPEARLESSLNIRRHPWFKSINWTDIMFQKVVPQYVPPKTHSNDESSEGSSTDTSNFSTEFTSQSTAKAQTILNEFMQRVSEQKSKLKQKLKKELQSQGSIEIDLDIDQITTWTNESNTHSMSPTRDKEVHHLAQNLFIMDEVSSQNGKQNYSKSQGHLLNIINVNVKKCDLRTE